jgi:predicted ATPase
MKEVEHIKIRGYKSIAECDLKLNKLNVLIGANGAGKSNFISVFRLLNNLIRKNLQIFVGKEGGADNLLHFGRARTEEIRLELSFGKNGYACALQPTARDSLIFAEEVVMLKGDNKPDHREPLGSGHAETKLLDVGRPVASYVVEAFKSWQVYHFHDTGENAKVKQTGKIEDNRFLRPDAGNLAAFLYFLQRRHKESYRKIMQTIRLIAPFFEDFALEPSRLSPDVIRLEWVQRGEDSYFDASQLSDGTLRMMSLATLLLQPDPPATIIIDEPELGLHPYALQVLASLLKTTSARRQIIVSTQSASLINSFSPENIIVVDHEGGASKFRRLDSNALAGWLEDYSLGELWQKNVLGGRLG